jgi:hypothetical protein
MKTLLIYIKNLIEKGMSEEKFRTINPQNKAFQKRVGGLIGGMKLLYAIGFEKQEDSGLLLIPQGQRDDALIQFARSKLEEAILANS